MRAGRSRRRRRHSSPLGAMSGREGVLDEPLIETLGEASSRRDARTGRTGGDGGALCVLNVLNALVV